MLQHDENVLAYLKTRSRLAYGLTTNFAAARRVRRPNCSWEQIIEYAFEFSDAFLRPLQVRSEIKAPLENIERLKPKTVLEIGTAGGGTFFMLARAAADDGHLISLDLPQGRWGAGYSKWKTYVFRRLIPPGQKADFIRKDSHLPEAFVAVKQVLRGTPVDVLFIDGDHSYAGVKQDFQTYAPLVRPNGLVLLHDIAEHPPEKQCHVSEFWKELRNHYRTEEFIENACQGWAGIGMIHV
jgi:predicted O-methyltransferase YrrM